MKKLSGQQVRDYDLQYNLRPWAKQKEQNPIAAERAEGIYFWDYEGKRYYDMSSQLVVSNLGHSNSTVIQAMKEQLDNFAYLAPAHAVEPRSQLAKLLIDKAPGVMKKVFFTCGGADSNENALLIARAFTGRNKVFSRYRSYHGSTSGAGNLSGDPRRFSAEHPAAPGYIKFFDPYTYREYFSFENDAAASKYYLSKLREQIIYEGPGNIAAIEIETITGSNGVIIPPDGYLQGVRKLCDEFGILMICDEVMAGFGRTGKLFAFEHWGIEPDIITFAKGVTAGYIPLGGVIVSERIAEFYDHNPLLCGLTYNGHALACAAGIATVNYYYDNNIFAKVTAMGVVLGELLETLKAKHPCVGDVRYIGLFAAVELVKDKQSKEPLVPYGNDVDGILPGIIGLLSDRGFATFGRDNNIMVAPPLIITEQELKAAIEILDEVLDIVDQQLIINDGGE